MDENRLNGDQFMDYSGSHTELDSPPMQRKLLKTKGTCSIRTDNGCLALACTRWC